MIYLFIILTIIFYILATTTLIKVSKKLKNKDRQFLALGFIFIVLWIVNLMIFCFYDIIVMYLNSKL